MPDQFHWIETTGGPHVLAPVEALADWRGTEGWRDNGPHDPSDYARACRSDTGWLSMLPSAFGEIIVFGGDRGAIAWFPNAVDDPTGVFVQWLGCDSEADVVTVLRDRTTVHAGARAEAETLEFNTGASGRLTLFDASESGLEPGADRLALALRPGRYSLAAYYIETDKGMITLRELAVHCRVCELRRLGALAITTTNAFLVRPFVFPDPRGLELAKKAFDPFAITCGWNIE